MSDSRLGIIRYQVKRVSKLSKALSLTNLMLMVPNRQLTHHTYNIKLTKTYVSGYVLDFEVWWDIKEVRTQNDITSNILKYVEQSSSTMPVNAPQSSKTRFKLHITISESASC